MQKLKVLMLAWEYPPRLVGGLARAVCAVSRELVKQGLEVHVITADHPGTLEHSMDQGVHVHRVKNQTGPNGEEAETTSFIHWVANLNFGIVQYALRLHQESPFDIVHAHDWLVADAARTMTSLGIPLIANIHATEYGRNRGKLANADSRCIDNVEWRLIYEARKIIVNSRHMHAELTDHFRAPGEKINIIPNGIEPDRLACSLSEAELRQKHGLGDGPVIFFVGRLVHEKGVQVLIEAAPQVLAKHPNATIMIAGTGYYLEDLQRRVNELGIAPNVRFFGQANDQDLSELFTLAKAAVVPSLYEPFGIVALEGMAASVPTIVADNGGLVEIVTHMENGLTTYTNDASSLAWGVLQVLDDAELSEKLSKAGRAHVLENYSWETITARTVELYREILDAC